MGDRRDLFFCFNQTLQAWNKQTTNQKNNIVNSQRAKRVNRKSKEKQRQFTSVYILWLLNTPMVQTINGLNLRLHAPDVQRLCATAQTLSTLDELHQPVTEVWTHDLYGYLSKDHRKLKKTVGKTNKAKPVV